MNQKHRLYLKTKMRTIFLSLAVCEFPLPRHKNCILPMYVEGKGIYRFAENME